MEKGHKLYECFVYHVDNQPCMTVMFVYEFISFGNFINILMVVFVVL